MKTANQNSLGFSLLTLVLLLSSASAFALHESPGRRTCRIHGGTSWDIETGTDQITLCRFGNLGVDANSFYLQVGESRAQKAVQAFLASGAPAAGSPQQACEANVGTYKNAQDLEGNETALCTFSDGSIIEARALSEGCDSSAGAALAQALRSK